MTAQNVKEAEQIEPLVHNCLDQFGLPEPLAIKLMTFSENAVYRVEFADAPSVVVRLHSIGYHTKAAIESELTWVNALHDDGAVRTAVPLRTASGELVVEAGAPGLQSRNASVLTMLPGTEPEDEKLESSFELLGRTTAVLHEHARRWNPPAGFHRPRWDIDGTLGDTPHWGRWQDGLGIDPDTHRILSSAERVIRTRLDRFGAGPARFGLIHADLRPANILLDGDDIYIIDFDDCGSGWFLYDLASALTFEDATGQTPALIDRWLDGYRSMAAVGDADVMEIPTFLMLRRLVLIAWLGSRPGTELALSEGPRYARVTADLAESYLSLMTKAGGPDAKVALPTYLEGIPDPGR